MELNEFQGKQQHYGDEFQTQMNFRENNNTMETNFKDTVQYSVFEIRLHSVVVFPGIHLIPKTIDARLQRRWLCSYKMTNNSPMCHVTMVYNVFKVVSYSPDEIVHMKYCEHSIVCINTYDTRSYKYFLFNIDVSHSIIHWTITNNYYTIYYLQLKPPSLPHTFNTFL